MLFLENMCTRFNLTATLSAPTIWWQTERNINLVKVQGQYKKLLGVVSFLSLALFLFGIAAALLVDPTSQVYPLVALFKIGMLAGALAAALNWFILTEIVPLSSFRLMRSFVSSYEKLHGMLTSWGYTMRDRPLGSIKNFVTRHMVALANLVREQRDRERFSDWRLDSPEGQLSADELKKKLNAAFDVLKGFGLALPKLDDYFDPETARCIVNEDIPE